MISITNYIEEAEKPSLLKRVGKWLVPIGAIAAAGYGGKLLYDKFGNPTDPSTHVTPGGIDNYSLSNATNAERQEKLQPNLNIPGSNSIYDKLQSDPYEDELKLNIPTDQEYKDSNKYAQGITYKSPLNPNLSLGTY